MRKATEYIQKVIEEKKDEMIKNDIDYELYNMLDVTLLADSFEHFRDSFLC